MRIIVPMAGMGKRMRPHTLTTPKPLLPIAGKPIVQRLVEDISNICTDPVEEIAFIIGDFGHDIEQDLVDIAQSLGAKGTIYHQAQALGTAHAILCAADSLEGPVIVAFADTLFKADFKLDESKDGILWVQKIQNPEQFGVVVVDQNFVITDFVEKPTEFISDLAMIGIYYFKDGNNLKNELQYLIDNDVIKGGEYQLPDALRNMTNKGLKFSPGAVLDWLDCGNKDATVHTNKRILEYNKDKDWVSKTVNLENTVIIPPCYIGKNVVLKNSVIGPHVSVGNGSVIESSVISNSIIQQNALVKNANFTNSMVGNFVHYSAKAMDVSLGDYSSHVG
ncbi:MAG: NTP transferase domain-containing protein [Flavobacteriales bacterium]|nr:NTP transferase domain-containing protein [Flavobacteriales bacterium]